MESGPSWVSQGARPGVFLLALVSALVFSGCKDCLGIGSLKDPIREAVQVLDDAIIALQDASADWQRVLQEAQSKLTDDTQSTIRNEIASVATRSIATAGVELRCEVDFVRERVRQALIRIRAKLLGQEVPPLEPGICQADPLAVERALVPARVSHIAFFGYDFDLVPNLKVFHEQAGGRQDVSAMLDMPTHYTITVKFGANGIQLDERSTRIALEWNGKVISSIAVIQPQTPVCESRVTPVRPGDVTFVPPHTRGDKDFDGDGPRVSASVVLSPAPNLLRALVSMTARETKSDWTTASGSQYFDLYAAPPGWKIDRVSGPLSSTQTYTDSNHDPDKFSVGSGGPAREFEFMGDTSGDEAGTRTKVQVRFNRLSIEETRTENCVPARAVRSLRERGLIGDHTFRRLNPGVERELERLVVPPQ